MADSSAKTTGLRYEVAVLYDPGLEVDLSKAEDRVKKIFSDNNAEVVATDNWGKKKLAYEINKNDHGIYVFYTVNMPAENVGKVEKTLNITDEVMRYLIVREDEKTLAKMAEAKEQKAKAEARAQERVAKSDEASEDVGTKKDNE